MSARELAQACSSLLLVQTQVNNRPLNSSLSLLPIACRKLLPLLLLPSMNFYFARSARISSTYSLARRAIIKPLPSHRLDPSLAHSLALLFSVAAFGSVLCGICVCELSLLCIWADACDFSFIIVSFERSSLSARTLDGITMQSNLQFLILLLLLQSSCNCYRPLARSLARTQTEPTSSRDCCELAASASALARSRTRTGNQCAASERIGSLAARARLMYESGR